MAATFSIASASVKCYINGKLLGAVMAIPVWSIQSSWGALREIDSVVARQLAPRTYACNGTIQILRGRSTGGLEGLGLVAAAESMLLQKYASIEVQDRCTDEIIFSAHHCQVDSQSWKVDSKGLIIGTFNFQGLTFTNEATQ
jgi:hypothetical protein